MAATIFTNSQIQTFGDNVKERYVQKSVLLPHFNVTNAKGEIEWVRLTKRNDATARGGKGTATPKNGTTPTKRQLVTQAWSWGDSFTDGEVAAMGTSPSSQLVQMGGDAIGVEIDKELIRAIGGTTIEGASTAKALPTGVNGQIIGDGTTAFSLDMLLAAHEKLDLANVPTGFENRLFIYPAQVLRQALKINEIANSLYNDRKALNDREVGTFTDCAWLNVQNLITPTAGVVRAYLVDKNAIAARFWTDLKVRVAEDPTNSFETLVYLERYFGAARLQEEGVVGMDIKVS